jgi:hypothetical protein
LDCGAYETYSYKLTTSEHPGDVPPSALKRLTQVGDTVVTDLITKTKLVTTTSLRPLHDLCMCTEAVRVGQMIYTLKRQRCTIYEFKTDSVLYRPPKRARTDALETLCFKDRLRDLFEPAASGAWMSTVASPCPTRMSWCFESRPPPRPTCSR